MKIVTIIGARPQFIKAATVNRITALNSKINEVIIHTGQHYDHNMSDVFFEELEIKRPKYNLGIGGGSHGQNTGRMIESIEQILISEKPNCVLVYGDTDSTLAGALSAAKLNIPIAHVEAGLRSYNRRMPEEINRVLTDHLSHILFTPTMSAVRNLSSEGIAGKKVRFVGDVMYDAALFYKKRAMIPKEIVYQDDRPFFLCTIHRAENTNDPKRVLALIDLINQIAKQVEIILPLHPRTVTTFFKLGNVIFHENVKIINPVSYLKMSWLLANCQLVLTDSGGVQKEAFFHRKPCAVLRDETEWTELLDLGSNILVSPLSSDASTIIFNLLHQKVDWNRSLFGNGQSAKIIVDNLFDCL
jgi:UDP-GlcNAc3NAcA epimerase